MYYVTPICSYILLFFPFALIGALASWFDAGIFVLVSYAFFLLVVMVYQRFYGVGHAARQIFITSTNLDGSRNPRLFDPPSNALIHDESELHQPNLEIFPNIFDSDSDYIYSPLQDSDIRLLKILPTVNGADPLTLELIHLPLLVARAISYIALSYTWGSEANHSEISLNGRRMKIRPNLERILYRVRSLKIELLWIDAICINQTNPEECSAQVLRMRGIYAGARSVLASINATMEESESITHLTSLVNPTLTLDGQADEVKDLCNSPATRLAIQRICEKHYWNRIWIVQEFAIPRSLEILLYDSVVKAEAIEMILELAAKKPGSLPRDRVKCVFDIRKAWQTGQGIPLLDILFQTRDSLCGKRHDRVFGLLGLALDELDFLSEPNYEADLGNLSISMTKSYVERRSIDIILLAPHGSEDFDLPSWCPNWFGFDKRSPEDRIHDQLNQRRTQDLSSQSPSGWYATGSTHAAFRFSGLTLLSSARCLGTIQSLGWCLSDSDAQDFPQHNRTWARRCTHVDIINLMYQTTLREVYKYEKPLPKHFKRAKLPVEVIKAYSWVYAFRENLGHYDSESQMSDFARWICANRNFSVGGLCLQEHARRLQHPLIYCNFALISDEVLYGGYVMSGLFWELKNMSSKNMRLMCLNEDIFGIGWASPHARLNDEVFLVPGCSMPVVLRPQRSRHRTYRLVGEAIVISAMKNEVWERTRPADLTDIEII